MCDFIGNMSQLTEIDDTKKVSFEEPNKDAVADSGNESSDADVAISKDGEGTSGYTLEDLPNKRPSRGEKKARKMISKLGLKQVC